MNTVKHAIRERERERVPEEEKREEIA